MMKNDSGISRRAWLGLIAGGAAAAIVSPPALSALAAAASPAKPKMTLYKSPTCGCCTKWVEHMTANGFAVTSRDVEDVQQIKTTMGVPQALQSCHTGIIGKYVVEGHVPADVVHRMLREKPALAGIAVPGMPVGSPGMEAGGRRDPYDVIAFQTNGTTRVFAKK